MALQNYGQIPNQGQQQPKRPFRESTRQKFAQAFGDQNFALGTQAFGLLPKVGYLSKIFIRFNGLITSTTGGADTIAYATYGPYSIFKNLQLDLNSGKQVLVSCSGWDLFLLNSVNKKSGRPDLQPDADFYSAPTSGTAQPFRVTLEIPVAVSDGTNFSLGLINLQAPELQCQLTTAFCNALTDIGTNIASITGSVQVGYQYYDVPDPVNVLQPYVMLHKILSQPYIIQSTGDNIVEIPRGGKLMRIIQTLQLNGIRSDSWDTVKIQLNKTQQIYRMDRWQSKFLTRRYAGFNLPIGSIVWDLQRAYDISEESDGRDMLDTEQATTTETVTTVTAGATLGSNNNFLNTLREFVQIPVG